MDIEANKSDATAGKVIAAIATDIGKLSTEIADVVGHTQSVQQALERQNERLKEIAVATDDIADANHAIADMAHRTHQGAQRARDDIDQSRRQIDHAIVEIDGLVAAVEQSGGELAGLEQAMARVAEVTGEIRNVARQTNMLALNATIEAARAGEAGRGFAVVAGEVKALARQTAEATARIDSTLAALTGQLRRLTDRMAISADRAGEVSRTATTIGGAVENVGQAVSLVFDDAAAIAGATDGIALRCDGFREQVKALEGDAGQSKVALDKAAANLANTLGGAEKILMMTASSGYPTEDSPFIDEVCKVAAAIEARFREAIERREISVEDLFDKALQPIAGSAPQQFMTRYIPFLDQAITPLMDKALELDRRVVFCAPSDHNLLLPCHNPAFRHPQGKDPVWNASHCRNRRIFDDKTARAAATSSAPFLLQTYRRDMGGGVFVLMKDASAPIRVEGRLWGGLRLCYTA